MKRKSKSAAQKKERKGTCAMNSVHMRGIFALQNHTLRKLMYFRVGNDDVTGTHLTAITD